LFLTISFDNSRPYQNIPFQYSLHYLKKEGARLKHYEYLAQTNIDPRHEFLKNLLDQIPENACVLAYNKIFEIRILNDLIPVFPEYKAKIENIINNISDLMVLFKNKDVYRWKMKGSYSLKYVLPAFVPDLRYEDMDISDGAMASNTWQQLWEVKDRKKIRQIRKALLEYCKMDTFGMVRILDKLRDIVD